MNERTACHHSLLEMQEIIEDGTALLSAIDWRTSYAALASRRALIEPYAKDVATQFARTLTTVCDLGCDTEDPNAFDRIKSAIHDLINDEFADEWRQVADKAAEARTPFGRAEIDADRAREDRMERQMMEAAE